MNSYSRIGLLQGQGNLQSSCASNMVTCASNKATVFGEIDFLNEENVEKNLKTSVSDRAKERTELNLII